MDLATKNKRNPLVNTDPQQRLVEHASAGCSDSFGQLIEQNHRAIRLYLGRYIQCPAQVDDLAQEVFFIAFGQLKHFRQEAKFSTWLVGIARIKVLEFLRAEIKARKKRKQFFEAEIASRQISRLENQDRERDLAQQRLSAMQSCLDQLPEQSRELIDRYYFNQQPATSIAAESNVSSGSIQMKLLRIRRILQKCIVARSQGLGGNLPVLEFDNERK